MITGFPGTGRHSVLPKGGLSVRGGFITVHPEDRFTAMVQREGNSLSRVHCTRRRLCDLARSSAGPQSLAARLRLTPVQPVSRAMA